MTPGEKRELRLGLFFVAPYLIGFSVFMLGPLVASFVFSFTDYDIFNRPTWAALDNFRALAHDNLFWTSLKNTAFYTVFSVPLGMLVAFSLALLLNRKMKARPLFRTIFFLPSIVPLVAASVLWVWIFNSQYGYLNWALRPLCDAVNWAFGASTAPPNWLQSPTWAKPALVIMSVWGVGGTMVLYLAALQDVPKSLYEVADLDGATSFQKIRHVTLPMISPILFFTLVMGLIGALQVFTQAYIMTKGGQPGVSTLFYCLYLFQNAFEYFRLGYASAMAWVLFALIAAITVLVFRITGRFIYYEGGGEQ
ncbi:MAG TPA: sugar ABC transporter permease [Candidatus Hydrogenedentes bacterium]|nr:sugar ABC transporter permease [Candidatus Hydrogenedentota bacterium]HPG68597.1 sugar ABC transporter permease [Candidatus Hydrogenedentota bacterium]